MDENRSWASLPLPGRGSGDVHRFKKQPTYSGPGLGQRWQAMQPSSHPQQYGLPKPEPVQTKDSASTAIQGQWPNNALFIPAIEVNQKQLEIPIQQLSGTRRMFNAAPKHAVRTSNQQQHMPLQSGDEVEFSKVILAFQI